MRASQRQFAHTLSPSTPTDTQRECPEQRQETSAACETAVPSGGLTQSVSHAHTHMNARCRYKNKHKDKRQKETCEKQKHENKHSIKRSFEASDAQTNQKGGVASAVI